MNIVIYFHYQILSAIHYCVAKFSYNDSVVGLFTPAPTNT